MKDDSSDEGDSDEEGDGTGGEGTGKESDEPLEKCKEPKATATAGAARPSVRAKKKSLFGAVSTVINKKRETLKVIMEAGKQGGAKYD